MPAIYAGKLLKKLFFEQDRIKKGNKEQPIRQMKKWNSTMKSALSSREVSSVSRSLGWIVLYDREFKTLAKVDSYLENLDMLKEYLASYGKKW